MMPALKQWIWFVGATAWYADAAINLHYNARGHAILSLVIASLFFLVGMIWVRNPRRD